ncbi:MAG TPA: hypothetical protein H9715_04735 [Candidatus Merdibacter merdigallinarum]|nr:hypothetical protein [Candidatus Merdibacter merdigallinarum]
MQQEPYRVVKLLRTHLYPTYQLFAYMANKKTDPHTGLRIAALTVLEWLRSRLGEDIPPELHTPGPEDALSYTEDALLSFHINHGFVIDVVSLPEQGIWTMQITEPDLGSDPGNPDQLREAMPGRIIETNIGFRIVGTQLACGFRTVIADPENTPTQAEVYRLAVVKRLARDKRFGLKQILPLTETFTRLSSGEHVKQLLSLGKNQNNQLPLVIFTQTPADPCFGSTTALRKNLIDSLEIREMLFQKPSFEIAVKIPYRDPPYDVEGFAKQSFAFCRTYLAEAAQLDRLCKGLGRKLEPGDILFWSPTHSGGSMEVLPYKPSTIRQNEALSRLRNLVTTYPRGKDFDFGEVRFLSDARAGLVAATEELRQESQVMADDWSGHVRNVESSWRAKVAEAEAACAVLQEQVERQKAYIRRIEEEKDTLRTACEEKLQQQAAQFSARDDYVHFLERKLDRPSEHNQIPAWSEKHFAERLLFHSKAISLLAERDAKSVDLDLICDALDFLATDYYARRFEGLSTEEMNTRCSQKYGRPFEVKPTGASTIVHTPLQYKIKYFPGRNGKPIESALDFHLCVGNDPESLLRIYFLHDDKKQRIVIGSLPRHLRAVTIQ